MKEKLKKAFDFVLKTTNGMAYGLFATLIIGTIIGAIGRLFGLGDNSFCAFMSTTLNEGASVLQNMTGVGIGIGIALSLEFDTLKTIALAIVGEIAAFFSLPTSFVTAGTYNNVIKIGDPLTIYLVVISVALLITVILKKKTPVDIILIPLLSVILGMICAMLIRYPTIFVTYAIQWLINVATKAQPFIMGIVIAVLMGMALTAPISSAAIAAIIFTGATSGSGLAIASGAAIVGCCTQMVGFAIQSRKDNKLGMVISVGIGTSMLQFKNILKKPIVWLPTIIASAILGPIATTLIHVECIGADAGMGTAGLVGLIGTITSMGADKWQTWVTIFGLELIFPAALVFAIDLLFRKFNLIKEGDLKI
ncbi:MAG: PTS sugar transporter subunit IIC [Erysipelotrichales bacterium]|nr:PTS sugar transporter subunit IIC [Erysipelotrichales bacterium]